MKTTSPARHAITDLLVLAGFAALAWGLSALFGGMPPVARWICAALLFLMLAGGYIESALPWWRARFRD